MKIEKIKIKNYRQYRTLEFSFSSEKLQLIKGIMGTGKTNFLNAINWCLYQEEPYLSEKSQSLPLLNLKTIDEADEGDIEDVIVEIWIKHEDRALVITRKAQFQIIAGKEKAAQSKTLKKDALEYNVPEFEIRFSGGTCKILRDEDAVSFIGTIVPNEIKDFFFFDGERLDRYFKEATGQHIRKAIFEISYTSLLQGIEKNLRGITTEYNKIAGKDYPNIEFIRTQLEDAEKRKTDIERIMDENKNQIKIAGQKINEINENLRGMPDVDELRTERETLKQKKTDLKKLEKEKTLDKQNLLFEYGKTIYFYPAINNAVQIITKKKQNGEIPPTGDKKLLENILKNKICSICGRKFDEGSNEEESVKKHLHGIKLSNEAAIELQDMDNPLRSYQEEFTMFKEKVRKISRDVEKYSGDIKEIDKRLNDIATQLQGFNEKKIRGWYRDLENFEHIYDSNNQSLGIQQGRLKDVIAEYGELKEKLDVAFDKEKKIGNLKTYIDFTSQAIEVLKTTSATVMDALRARIATETEKNFFDLMWRKATFEKIIINEDYEIKVNTFGYPVGPENLSGGERECMALSFTKALHSISGFDAPILIDRPLAMVSGPPRQHIAKILLKLADEKQLILFLTPDDYRDVSAILNSQSCEIHELRITKDEKEVKMEVV